MECKELAAAAQQGGISKVREILASHPALVNCASPDGWTPLHLAAYFGHVVVAEYLLENGADVLDRSQNAMANHPIHAAVAGKQSAMAVWLIEHGA